jgi:hypothetical protein
MTTCKALSGPLVIFAIALFCLFSPSLRAAEDVEVSTTSSSESETKSVPVSELGTGLFSRLPFHLSASVRSGYDDNVNTSSVNQEGSPFSGANLSLTYDFGTPRTKLSLGAGAGVTYYWDKISTAGTNNYDTNENLSFSLTHKVNPRLTLSTVDYLTYQSEPDFSISQGVNHRSGNFFFTEDKFSADYLWTPRFSTSTSYTFTALNYDDIATGIFEDRFENVFGNEFRFLIWPTTSLIAEYRFELVNYTHEGEVIAPAVFINGVKVAPATRLERDSTTQYLLAGFDHIFNPRFSVTFRGGAQFRDFSQGSNESSPYFEGTLKYVLGKQTSVAWTNSYGLEASDAAQSQSRQTFRTGVTAKHDFTPRISGNLAAYYENDDYKGTTTSLGTVNPSFTQQSLDIAVSLRYAVTRSLGLEAGYNYTDVTSDMNFTDYSRNRYWGGVNFNF